MKSAPLSEVKDQLSKYLRLAGEEPIVITRHGRAAGVLIGFDTEDDWLEYRLQHDPAFQARISAAREGGRIGSVAPVAGVAPAEPAEPLTTESNAIKG